MEIKILNGANKLGEGELADNQVGVDVVIKMIAVEVAYVVIHMDRIEATFSESENFGQIDEVILNTVQEIEQDITLSGIADADFGNDLDLIGIEEGKNISGDFNIARSELRASNISLDALIGTNGIGDQIGIADFVMSGEFAPHIIIKI